MPVQVSETKKDGKTYKNLEIKQKLKKENGNLVIENGAPVVLAQGLTDGESIIVTKKNFAEGRPVPMGTYTFYSCFVEYEGQDVSFGLSEKQHSRWKAVGGVGDKVSITGKQWFDKQGTPKIDFEFELAN
jgi:hypothetical protein